MASLSQRPADILYVTPYSGPSGANFSLFRLLENLDRDQFRPMIVCPPSISDLFSRRASELDVPVLSHYMEEWGQMDRGSMSLRRLLAGPKRALLRTRTIGSLARLIRRQQVAIVHTNSVLVMEGALAARFAGVPHVWHIRDRVGTEGSVQFRVGTRRATHRIADLSHTVVTISDYVREPFTYHDADAKTTVVYNSVALGDFPLDTPLRDGIRAEFGVEGDAPLMATVGHITPEKRHEDFIGAAARIRDAFPEARFLMVGKILDYHQAYHKRLQDLIKSFGLSEAVHFTDMREDIPAILSAIDLLIHPRTNEGFGRVIIEAMAASRPVVTVNSGGPPEIVVDQKTGILVPPASPDELAEATIQILDHPHWAQRMGQAGRMRVEQHFTDAVYVGKIQGVYTSILDRQ